jgi:pimeloyl-ACP methyl ester carboxylesterase
MHVDLARALAAQGHAVFRFDLPGVGESPRLSSLTPVDAVRAALDALGREHRANRFVVGGVCSAADLGWRVAERDPRVTGVLLLDGLGFGGPWFALAKFRRVLSRPPRHWPGMARRLFARHGGTAPMPTSADFRDWPSRLEAQAQMHAMLARGVRFLFIYTGGVSDRFLHPRQFSWSFGRQARHANVDLRLWPDCDHLFCRPSDRARLLRALADWLPAA